MIDTLTAGIHARQYEAEKSLNILFFIFLCDAFLLNQGNDS